MIIKSYSEIFKEVVDIMRIDSSTCRDMGAGPFCKYQCMINDLMSRKQFVKVMKMYISEFSLPGHLKFTDATMGNIDYKIIREENCLRVTTSARDSLLKKDDIIIKIDGKSIIDTATENRVFLMNEPNDRQTDLWWQILMFSSEVTVVRDYVQFDIPTVLSQDIIYDEEKYIYKITDNNRLYIRLADFYDDVAINDMLDELKIYLEECEELVIDVRGNGGGSSPAYSELLSYCFPDGKHEIKDYGFEINYTDRNCESRLRIFREFFGDNIGEELKDVLACETNEILANKGKGFVKVAPDSNVIIGRKYPLKVLVYTDEGCCSAGESFVETVSQSDKVTIIGRPTMGINDYSNCTNAVWGDFYLAYPTSRDCRVDEGKGILGKGVPVDIRL